MPVNCLFHIFLLILRTKIVKGERRGKRKTKFFKFGHAEPPPILSKNSTKPKKYERKRSFICHEDTHLDPV